MNIFKTLQEISAIPSLTFKEDTLRDYIQSILSKKNTMLVKGNTTQEGLGVIGDPNIIYIAHLDRVKTPKYKPLKIINGYLTGQLDNIIGVGALLYLLDQPDFQGSVLFTTQEEVVANKDQIANFANMIGDEYTKIIDIDIDPILSTDGNTLFKGLSTRRNDSAREYSRSLYKELTSTAEANSFRFQTLYSWIILQLSYLEIKNPVGFVGVPILNYHTNHEIAYWQSVKDLYKFLYIFSRF